MKRLAFLSIALIAAAVVYAATHTASWTAPTTNTDSSTISVPLTYNVYEGLKGAEVKTQSGVTALAATVNGPCVEVSAVEAGNEGQLSNEVCLPPVPNPPTLKAVQ